MPDIKYVCMSDMHLGAENGLLTNLKTASSTANNLEASPVLRQLVLCLKDLIDQNEDQQNKPKLILNGDILELALTTDNEAAMAFERFIELIFLQVEEPLFDPEIIYVPGNHDHHAWEAAREKQYADFLCMPGNGPGTYLKVPWHATKMYQPDPVPCLLMNTLIGRYPALKDVRVNTVYPNYGLLSSNGFRSIIFSHGHYIESIYMLMSTLRTMIFPDRKMPELIWDYEAENFAWIDFFWSTMGRSGDVGRDVALIYNNLQDEKQTRVLLGNLATSIVKIQNIPGWEERIEAKALTWLLAFIQGKIGGLERHDSAGVLSADSEKGLWRYIEGPLKSQITQENNSMPPDVTFIFGHTHKPFQEDANFKGYPQWVNLYNSGGWVVDTVYPEPLHGGAVILIDEELDASSLRMYNESDKPEAYLVGVAQATRAGEEENPFHHRLDRLVDSTKEPWRTFSECAYRAVRVRAQNLRASINSEG